MSNISDELIQRILKADRDRTYGRGPLIPGSDPAGLVRHILTLASDLSSGANMDRPAYELVRLLEASLDDADQITDSPGRPNNIRVWAVRHILENFGGKAHRWSPPRCFDCDHVNVFHHDWSGCTLCSCQTTRPEIAAGKRDESIDESIEKAADS